VNERVIEHMWVVFSVVDTVEMRGFDRQLMHAQPYLRDVLARSGLCAGRDFDWLRVMLVLTDHDNGTRPAFDLFDKGTRTLQYKWTLDGRELKGMEGADFLALVKVIGLKAGLAAAARFGVPLSADVEREMRSHPIPPWFDYEWAEVEPPRRPARRRRSYVIEISVPLSGSGFGTSEDDQRIDAVRSSLEEWFADRQRGVIDTEEIGGGEYIFEICGTHKRLMLQTLEQCKSQGVLPEGTRARMVD
jgi:hypothetical protein